MRIFALALAFMLCATTAFAIVVRMDDGNKSVPAPRPEPMPLPEPAPDRMPSPVPVPVPEPEPEPRPAPVEPSFTCAPDGFTLSRTEDGYHLQGKIEMPTPGFTYDIRDIQELRDGNLRGTFFLTPPDGAVIQVISPLDVSYDLARNADLSKFSLHVEKNFQWGAEEISCAAEGMTP